MDRNSLKDLLIKHEGLSLKPYKDSLGLLTIGYGRCLDTNGISEAEASCLLDNDIAKAVSYCRSAYSWFNGLDDNRQNVIVSMVFNMGPAKFEEFKKMILAIEKNDFIEASNQMLESQWASQVGNRAKELSDMMRIGQANE